ncbi:MAG TPA: hypothetical protein VEJ45_07935 [Candidatus Acidoferrales bacterium]|nr:hypothetical protein [Candidatus Acidoferrales bacterium]
MEQPDAATARVEAARSSSGAGKGELGDGDGLAIGYCPRCSARLRTRRCKLICPDCGYYMSCSDFY